MVRDEDADSLVADESNAYLPTTIAFEGEGPGGREDAAGSRFTFDGVLDATATQASIWAAVGREHVRAVMDGFNSTLLMYGRTGSGKTYTMMAAAETRDAGDWSLAELDRDEWGSGLGLLPRAVHALLRSVAEQREGRRFTVSFAAGEVGTRVWR